MQFLIVSIALLGLVASTPVPANEVKEKVTYSAPGTTSAGANGFGCADITPKGQNAQLGCVKHVFTDGFTVGVTDQKTKKVTLCSIAGTSGACGPAGVSVKVDLTGGTGTAPAASGPEGTTKLTAAELVNTPI